MTSFMVFPPPQTQLRLGAAVLFHRRAAAELVHTLQRHIEHLIPRVGFYRKLLHIYPQIEGSGEYSKSLCNLQVPLPLP